MENYSNIIIYALISFFSGAIPTGVIVSKWIFGFDIRTKGSGNMGSTNVLRVLGKKWGIIVQVVDMLKGFLPVYFLTNLYFNYDIASINVIENEILFKIILGLSAVLGHIFSPFVGFKGGKGINTATGMLFAIAPFNIMVAFVIFWLTVFSSGYISLGSISAALSLPIVLYFRENIFNDFTENYFTLIYFFFVVTTIVILTHIKNISRLLKGNENKFEKLHIIKFKK